MPRCVADAVSISVTKWKGVGGKAVERVRESVEWWAEVTPVTVYCKGDPGGGE